MRNARTASLAGHQPVNPSSRENGVDAGSVETNRRLWTETARPCFCAGDLNWLLDGLGIQVQPRGINVRIKSSFHQFGLSDSIPTLMANVHLDRRMRCQLKLLLQLPGSRGIGRGKRL